MRVIPATKKARDARERDVRELDKNCTKQDLIHLAQSLGIPDASHLPKVALIEEIVEKQMEDAVAFVHGADSTIQLGDNDPIPVSGFKITERRETQQFDVSENWFNKKQRLQVAGTKPEMKFAHVKYEPWAGGLQPTIVLTVEYSPFDAGVPIPQRWPDELEYYILVESGGVRPARPADTHKFLDVIGTDGRMFEVFVHGQPPETKIECGDCHGAGYRIMTVEVTKIYDAVRKYYEEQIPCDLCNSTGWIAR